MRMRRLARGSVVVALTLGLVQIALAQAPPPAASPSETGRRITLDLKGVDILDVLKLLSQKSGLNFVAGRNVSGRVTIFVNDVDVWEAFELIVGANDLAYEQHGTIVTVMMGRDYELMYGEKFQERTRNVVLPLRYAKVVQAATVLNQIKSSVGRVVADEGSNTLVLSDVPARLQQMQEVLKQLDRPVETRVYNLNYAEAEKLKEKVQEALSPVGTFTFDARTNKVIISDVKEVLAKTDRIISAFDVPEGQVLIEAKIVNVALTDDNSLGIDWQRVFAGIGGSVRGNLLTGGDVISGTIIGDTATATGSAFQLLQPTHAGAKVLIEALRKIGKTETLSNPRIMVSNNQEAKILVGTKEAFITTTTTVPSTGSTVSAPEVKTEDVGTKLFVTPNIKRDGYVQLKIRPEVSSVARTITSVANTLVPIVQTTEAETNVLVKSGVTVIIGGLIDNKDTRSENRIPWLGDMPILGAPFRGMNKTQKRSELVVFLTPQIILPDGTPLPAPPGETKTAEDASPAVILQDPVPASYRQTVRQRLQEELTHQFRAASLPRGSVVVSFVLSQDGQLVRMGEITSPQGEPFTHAAEAALKQAGPFPPFPEGSQGEEVRFRLAVEYAP